MVSCVASRIWYVICHKENVHTNFLFSVFSKALLVYLYDVYQVTIRLQGTYNLTEEHVVTACDQLKPLLQKLNIKLRLSLKPNNKLPNDKAISKSAFMKDEKVVQVSVDLGGMYCRRETNIQMG